MKAIKNVLYSLIFLVLALSLASTAYAAASFTMNDLYFGSDSQARGQDVSTLLHLVNDGNESLTIALTSGMPSVYTTRIVPSSITLAPGASADTTVTIFVPVNVSSGRFEITGGITGTATGVTKNVKTYLTTESMLEITKVAIIIDGGSEKSLPEDETYDNDLKAGTPITIKVYVKNNFGSSDDLDINDIRVDISGSGDLDLDEYEYIDDLSYGDKDSIEFTTEIPSDADDGDNYDIDVDVRGKDDNDVWHYDSFSSELEVKREAHEITFNRATLTPQTITCGGQVSVNVEIENSGRYDEDEVGIGIVNDNLNIDDGFYPLEMDTDDTIRKTFTFNVPKTTPAGQYDIVVTSYYDSSKKSNMEVLTLNVNSCQPTTTPTTPTTPTVITTVPQPTVPPVTPVTGATIAYGTASFTDSPTYLAILVVGVVLMLAILIILLVKFVF